MINDNVMLNAYPISWHDDRATALGVTNPGEEAYAEEMLLVTKPPTEA